LYFIDQGRKKHILSLVLSLARFELHQDSQNRQNSDILKNDESIIPKRGGQKRGERKGTESLNNDGQQIHQYQQKELLLCNPVKV